MTTEGMTMFVESQRGFCLDTLNALATQVKGNVMFSPYSLSRALFMLSVGAGEDSESRFEKCLKTGDDGRVHAKNGELHQKLAPLLRASNGLFAGNQYDIDQDYIDVIKSYYGGEFRSVDFLNDAANVCTDINNWVSVATEGMIDNLLSEIDAMTTLIIVNAIYFKGHWKEPFLPHLTTPQPFRTNRGVVKSVDTMYMCTQLRYYRDTEAMCQVLQIPYEHGASMYIILPFRDDIEALQKMMTLDILTKWTRELPKTYMPEIHLWLPKFKLESSFPLKEVMITLGLGHLFDSRRADLSGITDSNICVTNGIQKVVLEVDEVGTVASVATGFNIGLFCSKPIPIEFKVNRPFLFMIRDDTTGVDLFWGRVCDIGE